MENFEKPKHEYTVEITRAMYSQETFKVYCKYQETIHGKEEIEDEKGYKRFLCEVPLFDPNDKDDPEENKSGSNRYIDRENGEKPD